MKKTLLLFLLATLPSLTDAQIINAYIDSLESVLKTTQSDTARANTLANLASAHSGNNADKAILYATQSQELAEAAGFKKGVVAALLISGGAFEEKAEYVEAITRYRKALKISQETGDKTNEASAFNDIGIVYEHQGNYAEALKNYLTALAINEKTGDKTGEAYNLTNIGNIYLAQSNYPEALKSQEAALALLEKTDDKYAIANAHNNISITQKNLGNFSSALENIQIALDLNVELELRNGEANCLQVLGGILYDQGNYEEALDNYFSSLKIAQELGAKSNIASVSQAIGATYTMLHRFPEAGQYLQDALALSQTIGNLEQITNCYESLYQFENEQGHYQQALDYHLQYIASRDSLLSNESAKKTMQQKMQFDFDKKEAAAQLEQEKKDAVAAEESKRQKTLLVVFIAGFVVVLLSAVVFFRQRNNIAKEKKRSDGLLLNILPAEVAEELKEKGSADAQHIDQVTVLFTDFKGFTQLSEKLSPKALVAEINLCFSAFDAIMEKYSVEKIKTIGDAYMAAGGLPTPNKTHASDVVKAALEIQQFMQQHKAEKAAAGELFFEIRIGIHTGPVVAGIVGVKKFQYDIWGDTVNTASRMESSGEIGKVNISETTCEQVKQLFVCSPRGYIAAKGKGEIAMYFVDSVR
jgi:adenylate cyclase